MIDFAAARRLRELEEMWKALDAKVGEKRAERLFARAVHAVDLIDESRPMLLCLRGALLLAERPRLSARELADELSGAPADPEPSA